ncbi:unnamed protein product [Heligmosomoides polygyrus]|uniref:Uncharacterized protein n=1 Tax=Heligmosomoides polygyrus TaxID=6339 RepID=A0A183F4Z0_HELPZ|nr:unnamed protein product [Heligmosomoides polygyrus]
MLDYPSQIWIPRTRSSAPRQFAYEKCARIEAKRPTDETSSSGDAARPKDEEKQRPPAERHDIFRGNLPSSGKQEQRYAVENCDTANTPVTPYVVSPKEKGNLKRKVPR